MHVLVLNGSPKGKNSITLQTVLFIEKYFRNTTFEILHVGQKIRSYEKDFTAAGAALQRADLILFCYPVYTFLVPSQLHRFIELIRENKVSLAGKYASQISTSKHFYDTTAHQFIADNCADLGLRYVRGLSADMEDLLNQKGQQEALSYFRYVCWNMRQGLYEPVRRCDRGVRETAQTEDMPDTADISGKPVRIAIVADLPADPKEREHSVLWRMVQTFMAKPGLACTLTDIREFPFQGGCLGCFHCAADGTCVYKDGFDTYLREKIQDADALVYAFKVRDHSMGSRFKMFDDRQFCNGHRTVTMGKPVGYLAEGDLQAESNLQILMEARAQVGGNFLAGIACGTAGDVSDDKSLPGQTLREIESLARTLRYSVVNRYDPPKNFYGVGGMKIFRDLIYQMQGLMKEDHRFYKAHGFYDFPQKKKGMVAGMYLVGLMMSNQKLSRKLKGKMTEGMLLPYRHVLKQADKKRNL